MHANHFADLATQPVGDALTLVDVDADSFTKDQFHGGRVTQLNDKLHNEVDTLVVWRHSVEMDGVVHRGVPRYQRTDLHTPQHKTRQSVLIFPTP